MYYIYMKNKKTKSRKRCRSNKRSRRTKRRMVNRRGGASWSDIRGDLPTRTFLRGMRLFKGSMGGWATCKKILDYHDEQKTLKLENQSSMDPDCTNKTSVYLGPSEERSRQYWKEGNAWLVFKLTKDLTLLDLTPEMLKKHHMRLIVDKALINHPGIECYLYNLESFGRLSNLCLEGDPNPQLEKGICNKDFKNRLAELFCLIFGIEKTVKQQQEFLQELL